MGDINFKFVELNASGVTECDEYLSTYDAKAEGCISLAITLTEVESVIF